MDDDEWAMVIVNFIGDVLTRPLGVAVLGAVILIGIFLVI